jgi:Fe2+ or Zn2+ uptake regulation protein
MSHPAQIRDAVQVYVERQDRPIRTWHVQDEIANRLDTRHALVYEALMRLEQVGTICKHVSPENGTEYWFSPKSETFCGKCGQLALPGVHTQPDCPRRKQTPAD